jgi:hypothetical protein
LSTLRYVSQQQALTDQQIMAKYGRQMMNRVAMSPLSKPNKALLNVFYHVRYEPETSIEDKESTSTKKVIRALAMKLLTNWKGE